MTTTATTSAAERVERFRQVLAVPRQYEDYRAAALEILDVATDAALASLAEGDGQAALAWSSLAQAHMFKYRRSF